MSPQRSDVGRGAGCGHSLGYGRDIFLKSVYRRTILTYRNFANFSESVKDVATVDGYVDMYICRIGRRVSVSDVMVIHICVRPLHSVARSTDSGNAKASIRGSEQQIRLSRFFIYNLTSNNTTESR